MTDPQYNTSDEHTLIWGDTPLAAWLCARWMNQGSVAWLASAPLQTAIQSAGGITFSDDPQNVVDLPLITDLKTSRKPTRIILAMPIWAMTAALRELATFIPPGTDPPPLVTLTLGIGAQQRIEGVFGSGRQHLAGVITKGFRFGISPNDQQTPIYSHVHVTMGGGVALQHDHPDSMRLANTFRQIGLSVALDDADAIQWSGVLWGLQANALAAILDVPASRIYQDATLFAYEYRQLAEALMIIHKLGVRLVRLPGVEVHHLARDLHWIPRSLVRHSLARYPRPPALRDDLAQGRGRSDAAYLNGAVAVHADRLKLVTPVNHALALTVTDIAEGRALWSQYRGNPKLLLTTLRLALGGATL